MQDQRGCAMALKCIRGCVRFTLWSVQTRNVLSKLSKNVLWPCWKHGQRTVFQGHLFFPPSDVIKHVIAVASATIVCSNLLRDEWSKSGTGPKFVWVIVYCSLLSTRVHVLLILWVYSHQLLVNNAEPCLFRLTHPVTAATATILLLALLLRVRIWSE